VPTFLFGSGKQESRPNGRLSSGIQESFEAFISGGAGQDRTDDLLNAIPTVSLDVCHSNYFKYISLF
jgi:hypothetical protein